MRVRVVGVWVLFVVLGALSTWRATAQAPTPAGAPPKDSSFEIGSINAEQGAKLLAQLKRAKGESLPASSDPTQSEDSTHETAPPRLHIDGSPQSTLTIPANAPRLLTPPRKSSQQVIPSSIELDPQNQAPQVVIQLLQNGDFETDTAWFGENVFYTSEQHYSGNRSVEFGPGVDGYVYQLVQIPQSALTLELSYFWKNDPSDV